MSTAQLICPHSKTNPIETNGGRVIARQCVYCLTLTEAICEHVVDGKQCGKMVPASDRLAHRAAHRKIEREAAEVKAGLKKAKE